MCKHELDVSTVEIADADASRVEIEAQCVHCSSTLYERVGADGMASYLRGGQ